MSVSVSGVGRERDTVSSEADSGAGVTLRGSGSFETLSSRVSSGLSRDALRSNGSMFDRFAGIYHAFGCLRRYIDDATEDGRAKEASARLLGAKYDSLPCLLEKTLE